MTSQAPYRCEDSVLITQDENKAKADTAAHSLNNTYIRHKYRTTAAYEERIYIFFIQ